MDIENLKRIYSWQGCRQRLFEGILKAKGRSESRMAFGIADVTYRKRPQVSATPDPEGGHSERRRRERIFGLFFDFLRALRRWNHPKPSPLSEISWSVHFQLPTRSRSIFWPVRIFWSENGDRPSIIPRQKCFPVSEKCFPISEKCFPVSEKCFPVSEKCFSVSEKCFSLLKKCFPVLEKCFPFLGTLKCFSPREKYFRFLEKCFLNFGFFIFQ